MTYSTDPTEINIDDLDWEAFPDLNPHLSMPPAPSLDLGVQPQRQTITVDDVLASWLAEENDEAA